LYLILKKTIVTGLDLQQLPYYKKMPLLIIAIFLFLGGCASTPLLTKDDYGNSLRHFSTNKITLARELHPRLEDGSFIALMETTYLDLLQGKPDIEPLAQYAKLIEDRVRYDVSREIESFFYVETPEQYYASEHEIVWMHLLLSWGYSLKQKYESACVEARKASHLLSHTWSEEGHFDHASLRIFSGVMFSLCGEWAEAVVDFRVAQKLEPKLTWLKELSELTHAPKQLVLGLGGIGPEPEWNPDLDINVARSMRQVSFYFGGRESDLEIHDRDKRFVKSFRTPVSREWYHRHMVRDNEIQDLIKDTKYAGNLLDTGLEYSLTTAGTVIGGVAIATVGIALGAGITYVAIQAESMDIFLFGLAVAGGSVSLAVKKFKEQQEWQRKRSRQKLDPSKKYRFVRYLPEYFWLSWSDKALKEPIFATKNGKEIAMLSTQENKRGNAVSIFFFADYPAPKWR